VLKADRGTLVSVSPEWTWNSCERIVAAVNSQDVAAVPTISSLVD